MESKRRRAADETAGASPFSREGDLAATALSLPPSSVMSDGGPKDPADIVARARAELGLSHQLGQERRIRPPPWNGGSEGYPEFSRLSDQDRYQNNMPTVASGRSVRRWNREGVTRKRKTGNKERSQVVGTDMVNMVTFIIAYPTSTCQEIAVNIYNSGRGGELYSVPTVSKQLKELEITKKKASTEAHQAQSEDVQFRLECFFDMPCPLGVRVVPRYKLIDVDEFGVTLEKCNRNGGWTQKVAQVRTDGHYQVWYRTNDRQTLRESFNYFQIETNYYSRDSDHSFSTWNNDNGRVPAPSPKHTKVDERWRWTLALASALVRSVRRAVRTP